MSIDRPVLRSFPGEISNFLSKRLLHEEESGFVGFKDSWGRGCSDSSGSDTATSPSSKPPSSSPFPSSRKGLSIVPCRIRRQSTSLQVGELHTSTPGGHDLKLARFICFKTIDPNSKMNPALPCPSRRERRPPNCDRLSPPAVTSVTREATQSALDPTSEKLLGSTKIRPELTFPLTHTMPL